jgi:hypothetical protein
MRIYFFLIIFLILSCGNKNTNTTNPTVLQTDTTVQIVEDIDTNFVLAFLNIDFKGNINVYEKPNGKILQKIKNYMFNEDDIIIFKVIEQNDTMFYVTAYYNYEKDSINGWIKKNDNIGIYSKAYDQPLKLYVQPDEKSKVLNVMHDYCPDMFIVTEIKNKWVRVKIKYNNKIYQGWMPPDMQCANPYSTCS